VPTTASSSEGSCALAKALNTTPVDAAESDCAVVWSSRRVQSLAMPRKAAEVGVVVP